MSDDIPKSTKPYRYEEAKRLLRTILEDLEILSGDAVGPSDVTWQSVAATAAVNCHVLAIRLQAARYGEVAGGPIVFPSPNEVWGRRGK